MVFTELLVSTLTQGLLYAILSYGVYITYKILDFPDMTTDGSFPLGAAVTAVLLLKGVNPFLILIISMIVGAMAGLVTGLIHVRLGVRDLLAGIIVMTALFSINLQIAGSNLAIDRSIQTIYTSNIMMFFFGNLALLYRKFIVALIVAVLVKLVLDLYLKTKSGLILRAVGDNSILVTSLAKDKGNVKILGLAIANAMVALCGSVICQEQRAFSATMGTGQVVFGLATVIIGATLSKKIGFIKGTSTVLIGSIFYKICIQIAISLGLPANLLKLAMAVLFLTVLVLGDKKKGGRVNA